MSVSLIKNRYVFDLISWIDCGHYWLNKAPQGSDEWKLNRKYRLTASNFGAAIGKSCFSTPHDIAAEIANVAVDNANIFIERPHCNNTKRWPSMDPDRFNRRSPKRSHNGQNSPKIRFNQQHGVITESKARDWYCKTRNVTIVEVGLAVPKWEQRIGASLDGDITGTDGIVEIKCPFEMYEQLKSHIDKIKFGWRPSSFYHEHIRESHYAQMQGSMKIFGKQWCDYIVYATESNLSYVERIPFNKTYWDDILWPGITHFLDNIIEPIIQSEQTVI